MSPTSHSRSHPARRPLATKRRRLRGFAAGLTALCAASAAAVFAVASVEISERRAFDYAGIEPAGVSHTRVGHTGIEKAGLDPAASGASESLDASAVGTLAAFRRDASIPRRRAGVALIGDSWVSKSKLDAPLSSELASRGLGHLPVKGIGQGGATSRVILRNLLSTDDSEFASRELLEGDGFRYCVVVAGVNDSANHLGADFYSHHVAEVVEHLVAHGVTPIVLELPEYGIEAIREKRDGIRLLKDLVLSALYDDFEVDVIGKYRVALRAKLAERDLLDAIELVPFAPIVEDYHAEADLYRDPAHLNDRGRERLVDALADVIENRIAMDARLYEGGLHLATR